MNRIYSIITFLFLSIVATNAQKIGYINSQEILASLPEVKQANSDIEVMKTMFQKKGEDMVKELQAKYQDLEKTTVRRTCSCRNRKTICSSQTRRGQTW